METFRTEHHYGSHRNQFSHRFAFLSMIAASLRVEAYFNLLLCIVIQCHRIGSDFTWYIASIGTIFLGVFRLKLPLSISISYLWVPRQQQKRQEEKKLKSCSTFPTGLIMSDVVNVQLELISRFAWRRLEEHEKLLQKHIFSCTQILWQHCRTFLGQSLLLPSNFHQTKKTFYKNFLNSSKSFEHEKVSKRICFPLRRTRVTMKGWSRVKWWCLKRMLLTSMTVRGFLYKAYKFFNQQTRKNWKLSLVKSKNFDHNKRIILYLI